MKDCSVARLRQNLLPRALELLSQPPSLSSFFSFRVPFIILGFMEGNLGVFGLFRAISELYSPIWWSSAAALHFRRCGAALWRCGATYQRCEHPRRCLSARTDFQNGVSPSLLIQITHMIRRWKALSMIFNLICNMLHKTSRNIHENLPQRCMCICLSLNCSEFARFCSISSHLLPMNLYVK